MASNAVEKGIRARTLTAPHERGPSTTCSIMLQVALMCGRMYLAMHHLAASASVSEWVGSQRFGGPARTHGTVNTGAGCPSGHLLREAPIIRFSGLISGSFADSMAPAFHRRFHGWICVCLSFAASGCGPKDSADETMSVEDNAMQDPELSRPLRWFSRAVMLIGALLLPPCILYGLVSWMDFGDRDLALLVWTFMLVGPMSVFPLSVLAIWHPKQAGLWFMIYGFALPIVGTFLIRCVGDPVLGSTLWEDVMVAHIFVTPVSLPMIGLGCALFTWRRLQISWG